MPRDAVYNCDEKLDGYIWLENYQYLMFVDSHARFSRSPESVVNRALIVDYGYTVLAYDAKSNLV